MNRKDGDDALHLFSRVAATLICVALLVFGIFGPVPLQPIGLTTGTMMLQRHAELFAAGTMSATSFDYAVRRFDKSLIKLIYLGFEQFQQPLVYRPAYLAAAERKDLRRVMLRRVNNEVVVVTNVHDIEPKLLGGPEAQAQFEEEMELVRRQAMAHGSSGRWDALFEVPDTADASGHSSDAAVLHVNTTDASMHISYDGSNTTSSSSAHNLSSTVTSLATSGLSAAMKLQTIGLDASLVGMAVIDVGRTVRYAEVAALIFMVLILSMLLMHAYCIWRSGRFSMVSVAHEVEQALQRLAWDPLGEGHADALQVDGSEERAWVKRAVQRLIEGTQVRGVIYFFRV